MWNNPKYTTGKIQSQGMEKSKVYAEADATTLMEAGIWTRMLPSSSCGTGSFDVVLFFVFVLGVNRQQKTPSGKRPAALWYTEGSETVKEERDMKVVLVGTGSIGGTIAVLLQEHGHDLDVVAHGDAPVAGEGQADGSGHHERVHLGEGPGTRRPDAGQRQPDRHHQGDRVGRPPALCQKPS